MTLTAAQQSYYRELAEDSSSPRVARAAKAAQASLPEGGGERPLVTAWRASQAASQ